MDSKRFRKSGTLLILLSGEGSRGKREKILQQRRLRSYLQRYSSQELVTISRERLDWRNYRSGRSYRVIARSRNIILIVLIVANIIVLFKLERERT